MRLPLTAAGFVIATAAYAAQDPLQLIDVECQALPAMVNARKAGDPEAPLIRDDRLGQVDNLAYQAVLVAAGLSEVHA